MNKIGIAPFICLFFITISCGSGSGSGNTPPALNTIVVSLVGTGTGKVTSSPAGISCKANCSAGFESGTSVTLTAISATDSIFTGWSGACSGTGPCVVTMNANTMAVTAKFNQIVTTWILSDPVYDGNIQVPLTGPVIVTQGMNASVQSVFAGVDPITGAESRAFLDFPLGHKNGIPLNAIIESATLHIGIKSIQPPGGTIPIRIDLVSFHQPPILLAPYFDLAFQPPLVITTIAPPISSTNVGNDIQVDVTSLMVEVQRLGLPDLQVRMLKDLTAVASGLIEINDTTGTDQEPIAPLLTVTYF